jgi:phage tail-like protein
MWDWFVSFSAAKNKAEKRKSVSVVQLDPEGRQLYRWDLAEAYPVKWTAPSYNAGQSGVSIEQFELAFTTLTAVKV